MLQLLMMLLKNTKAIKQSLELGFDKSNLRQDVKDKIMRELKSVPKIDAIIEAAKDTIKKRSRYNYRRKRR